MNATSLPTTAPEGAAMFLNDRTWPALVEQDLNVAPGPDGTACIAFLAPWPDAGHVAQALTTLDREIRRAATAWIDFGGPDGARAPDLLEFAAEAALLECRPEDRIRDAYKSALEAHPEPRHDVGSLMLTASRVEPFAVLLEPTGPLAHLLATLPASTAAYALSAFGVQMRIKSHWHARLEGAQYGAPDETLRVLLELVGGRWAGSDRGHQVSGADIGGRPSRFRAVSSPPSGSPKAAAVLYVRGTSPATDAATIVELEDVATSAVLPGDAGSVTLL